MSQTQAFTIKLPRAYRSADFLAFHQRDPLMIAERVNDNSLTKGIMWHGQPAQLQISFQKNIAAVQFSIEGTHNYNQIELQKNVERILGLQQDIKTFEKRFIDHPHIGSLITKNSGLRVVVSATPFEAISWAITGQQISVSAAISIRRKFIQLVNVRHSSGLWCYPDEHCVSKLSEDQLRQVGFSQAKANTLISLSKALVEQKINLNPLQINRDSIEQLSNQLLQIRGIGPWSINYALLRGFGWLDGSLHGDVAVRRSLQALLGASEKISAKETQQWLLEFSPWRALVAAHLWEMHKDG